MKLYDSELEIKVLRTLCSRRNNVDCAKMLAQINMDFFRDNNSKYVFRRIRSRMQSRGTPPSWSSLRVDPSLSDKTRKHIKMHSDVQPLSSKSKTDDYDELFQSLNQLYQARTMWEVCESTLKDLEVDDPNIPELMTDLSESVSKARAGASFISPMRIGSGEEDSSQEEFDKIMSNERPEVIPTGLEVFDRRNGGLLRGSLVVIAAPSGAGKTTFLTQLLINIATKGSCYQTCINSLEMTRRQMLERIYANYANMPRRKLSSFVLSPQEKKKLRQYRKKLMDELDSSGGSIDVVEHRSDVSVEDILNMCSAYDIAAVDQLTLTSDASSHERQWAMMGEACRVGKRWAVNNNKVVVILTQLDEFGNVKYSRGVLEHADLAFKWMKDDHVDEGEALMEVRMPKARLQDAIEFSLTVNVFTGRIEGSDHKPRPEREERQKKASVGGGKRRRSPPPKAEAGIESQYIEDATD